MPAGDGAAMAVLQAGLSSSLVLVFWSVAAFSVAILAISWAVPDLAEERILESEVRNQKVGLQG